MNVEYRIALWLGERPEPVLEPGTQKGMHGRKYFLVRMLLFLPPNAQKKPLAWIYRGQEPRLATGPPSTIS